MQAGGRVDPIGAADRHGPSEPVHVVVGRLLHAAHAGVLQLHVGCIG